MADTGFEATVGVAAGQAVRGRWWAGVSQVCFGPSRKMFVEFIVALCLLRILAGFLDSLAVLRTHH